LKSQMNRGVAFLVLGLFSCLSAQQLVDGVAAAVGEKVILKSEVMQLAYLSSLQSGINPNQNPVLFNQYQDMALDNLIIQNILLDRARVDSMDIIEDEEVDQMLDQRVENILAQIGSEEQFEIEMGQRVRDFSRDYWGDVRDQIIADRYRSEKIQSITVTRDEVAEFYEVYKDSIPAVDTQYELSQILVPIIPGAEAHERALRRINAVREELLEGAAFENLAQIYSDDPISSARGGDLGFVRRGEFVQEFEEAAFGLQEGEISPVVKTAFGYHIIELLEKVGEKIHVRHILVTVEPTAEDRETALGQVRNYFFSLESDPILFDTIIQQISGTENPPQELGYIGWVERGQLPSEAYRSALFNVQQDDITPPFETSLGFHILKVINLKNGGAPNLEEYYPRIAEFALRYKQASYLENWLDRVRQEVFIRIMD
jgi:peptidyl-prolyl cis-trans isomerase SurA